VLAPKAPIRQANGRAKGPVLGPLHGVPIPL